MKIGDLVLLQGGLWSSYAREGEVGILLETKLMTNRNDNPSSEFSRVLWNKDGDIDLLKTKHLEVINESR